MNPLLEQILPQLKPAFKAQRLVVAYSGGLDSHSLLALLVELRDSASAEPLPPLCALHVHHGVSANADAWAQHCRRVCDALDVAFKVAQLEAPPAQANLEQYLRTERYRVFAEELAEHELLLLAHHSDDQTETLLLRLLRGAGLKGALGMPGSRRLIDGPGLKRGQLLRPLLGVRREVLAAYARQRGLQWIEDESNADIRFDRNYLRHQITPLLRARWPGLDKSLQRFMLLNQQVQASADYFLARELPQLLDSARTLDLELLQGYPAAVQLDLLRAWCEQLAMPVLEYRHYHALLQEVALARADAAPSLVIAGVEFRRHRRRLAALKPQAGFDAGRCYLLTEVGALPLEGAGLLEIEAVARSEDAAPSEDIAHSQKNAGLILSPRNDYEVRFRCGGERCRPLGRGGSRSLKKLLQELEVPPWLRERVPLIFAGDELAAIADLMLCEGFAARPAEPGWCLRWQPPELGFRAAQRQAF